MYAFACKDTVSNVYCLKYIPVASAANNSAFWLCLHHYMICPGNIISSRGFVPYKCY
jgi:hypothetical protein